MIRGNILPLTVVYMIALVNLIKKTPQPIALYYLHRKCILHTALLLPASFAHGVGKLVTKLGNNSVVMCTSNSSELYNCEQVSYSECVTMVTKDH